VNLPHSDVRKLPPFLGRAKGNGQAESVETPKGRRGALADSVFAGQSGRQDRDYERGYSINVKQVALAFAVEFFIIGLILTGQYLIAEEAAQEKVFSILLFPIGLAVVELARVPLAIAVRTQNLWSVKLFAALGVTAAVTVTSFSLSTIAYQTFDPRLAVVNEKGNILHDLKNQKSILTDEIGQAALGVEQKRKDRDTIRTQYNDLESQIGKLKAATGETCTMFTDSEGIEKKSCRPTSSVSPGQLRTLQNQLAITKKQLDDSEAALSIAEANRARFDSRPIDEKIAKAETEYRIAVDRSQLHSYTSMILRKAPTEVTDAEVKGLESYLIFIPSIAAALASTLLAITAVRRIPRRPGIVTTIPDEAAAYLFGPLMEAIKKQAGDAVAAAITQKTQFEAQEKAASA